ncbi:c-type cytochrome [Flavobacterium sp.]|uniref:c-type cytochrome n=1 Tax=Flavobacterium sp. TaxID=239 RepID=UPI00333E5098
MKVYFKLFLTLSIGISIISCGEKKETDAMGNPINQAETSVKQTPKELGKELFEGKGMCATCHKADVATSGPSIKDISKIYTDKKASISLFLQGETDPIVDPSQYEIMKANLEITKAMTEAEVQALETYMLSIK